MIRITIVLEGAQQMWHFFFPLPVITDLISSHLEAVHRTHLHAHVVVGGEVSVLICVCGLLIHSCSKCPILLPHQNIQKENLLSFLLLSCELYAGILTVEVLMESFKQSACPCGHSMKVYHWHTLSTFLIWQGQMQEPLSQKTPLTVTNSSSFAIELTVGCCIINFWWSWWCSYIWNKFWILHWPHFCFIYTSGMS